MNRQRETEVDFGEEDWKEATLLAEDLADAAILLRVSTAMKTALTVKAGKLTAATGKRVSVNALIKTMITNALNEEVKINEKPD